MTEEMVMSIGAEAIKVTMLLAGPLLIAAMVIGILVSVLQAITQINEATLTFIPKLIAAMLVFALAGPWMLSLMIDYIRRTIESIPASLI